MPKVFLWLFHLVWQFHKNEVNIYISTWIRSFWILNFVACTFFIKQLNRVICFRKKFSHTLICYCHFISVILVMSNLDFWLHSKTDVSLRKVILITSYQNMVFFWYIFIDKISSNTSDLTVQLPVINKRHVKTGRTRAYPGGTRQETVFCPQFLYGLYVLRGFEVGGWEGCIFSRNPILIHVNQSVKCLCRLEAP